MNGHLDQETADEFAIGALGDEAAVVVADHIAVCEACARMVAEADRVAATLLLGVPRNSPPPELREKVFRKAGISRPGHIVWATRLATAGAGIAAVVVAIGISVAVAVSQSSGQITGTLGSPSATTTIGGEQLPPPPSTFGGNIERNAAYAFARITCTPAAGVSSYGAVLIVDAGARAENPLAVPAQKNSATSQGQN